MNYPTSWRLPATWKTVKERTKGLYRVANFLHCVQFLSRENVVTILSAWCVGVPTLLLIAIFV